jgi:hypothetical protein
MDWHRTTTKQQQSTKFVTKVYDIKADSDELGDQKFTNLKDRLTNRKVGCPVEFAVGGWGG